MRNDIEGEARRHIQEQFEHDPKVESAFWFLGDFSKYQTINIAFVRNDDPVVTELRTYYFGGRKDAFMCGQTNKEDGDHYYSTRMAHIHPDQINNIKLPEEWGEWKDAVRVDRNEICEVKNAK